MSAEKTYQPGWGEEPKEQPNLPPQPERKLGWKEELRLRDRQAYIGLLVIIAVAVGWVMAILWTQLKSMPLDTPETEWDVDELRIHKADEQDALLLSDSLAQAYDLDSIQRRVQIETQPVYRPPRQESTWYITWREWKEIFR